MTYTQGLFDFIKSSPTAYHAVETVKAALTLAGYTEISEGDSLGFSDGGKHFVVRGGTSIIAFRGRSDGGFMICASHSDSPTFKVKTEETAGPYLRLSTEKYGGMIYYSWLDRPLSVAGRAIVRTDSGVECRTVNLDRDLLTIPSVAIHMNRGVNDGYKFNPATDMLPLFGAAASKDSLMRLVAEAAGTTPDNIVAHDLFLYNREEGRVFGANDEFLITPRFDNLSSVYTSLVAFLATAEQDKSVPVLAVFDNEEVGSSTKQGANSTFLDMTLRRIAGSEEKYASMLNSSLMVSLDCAHARHPNHPELSDSKMCPVLGEGLVVKYNASQHYTTDGLSDGIFREMARRAGIKLQSYSNRADQPGGSTLGSIANTKVSVMTVDVGLPQLAMHSATECGAVADISDTISVLREMYSSAIKVSGGRYDIIK